VVFINQNRSVNCKNTLGGVKSVYLAPYKKVLRSEIIYDGVEITQFPETFIYKFDLFNATFNQEQTEDEGGKYYNQNINLTFNKLSVFDNINFQKLLRKDYFLVIQDNNNNYFLMGFRNGATCEKLETTTTSYSLSFEAKEEEIAPFVNTLINNGLIIFDGEDYIFENDTNYIFENDTNYIFN